MRKKDPTELYKYISFEQFVDLIENERLYLTKIVLWDDCYEGYFYRQLLRDRIIGEAVVLNLPNPKERLKSLEKSEVTEKLESLYGQSWIYNSDKSEDAMWRIYSPNKTGIRIKIKRDNIYNQLKLLEESENYYEGLSHNFVDYTKDSNRVVYPRPDVIKEIYRKRSAFSHENEYRFVMQFLYKKTEQFQNEYRNLTETSKDPELLKYMLEELEKTYSDKKVIYYKVPHEIIEEITLDPRAPEYFEETFIKYCENRDLKNFSKSELYTLQKDMEYSISHL